MANNRYGYTNGYTKPILGRKESCDVRRKPEKKTCGQWGPRRQTKQAVATHAPGTPPPERSMMTDIEKLIADLRKLPRYTVEDPAMTWTAVDAEELDAILDGA